MKRLLAWCVTMLASSYFAQSAAPQPPQPQSHQWAVVMHGGAGVIERSSMTPEAERGYRAGMQEAITAGGRGA